MPFRFWRRGKQNTGYFKCRLGGGRFPFSWNLELIKYPRGAEVPWHLAHASGQKHYILQTELWPAWEGGLMEVEEPIWTFPRREFYFVLFRADKSLHRVTRVKRGTRVVLSLRITF